ncbi:DUF2802 domain-containing protein [Ferrimonas balearica]|nr:DUF2802 domain-containing protein [Ferrimonas balearica]MBW3138177.1 DUF2802 domain-containing protein [Ferrimonas balearica]MBW3164268.1 DUF2802 domain-containing protein [Ferrimonas balearica]MBY5978934.1 DUF2802 domain-containing protein [Ferrimonas balearica]MBY6105242.1 DUF2802 domain-containing protein [Ferrimonas balearica]MBY6225092.1 DUF2802 domain-containing protein [Ferrimonas balearica]
MDWAWLIALLALVLGNLALFNWARKRIAGLERKDEALKTLHKAAQKQNDLLKRELAELRTGAMGVGKRVKELEQSISLLQARQDEVVQQDPEARLYSRAMKMVELGADVDEIMRECELPRAEAQLLVTLHQRGE